MPEEYKDLFQFDFCSEKTLWPKAIQKQKALLSSYKLQFISVEVRAGTMLCVPWYHIHSSSCFLAHLRGSCLESFLISKNGQPKDGNTHNRLSFLASIKYQDKYPKPCLQANLIQAIPQWRFTSYMSLVCVKF